MTFFGVFAFKSTGVYLRVFGLLKARKIQEPCLLVVAVFFVCFRSLTLSFFQFFKSLPLNYLHHIDQFVICNATSGRFCCVETQKNTESWPKTGFCASRLLH